MRCGTPGYVAPELMNNEGYDEKSDLFGVGIIMYQMLTGNQVFKGKTFKEVIWRNTQCDITFPNKFWGRISVEAKELTMKLLERNPN